MTWALGGLGGAPWCWWECGRWCGGRFGAMDWIDLVQRLSDGLLGAVLGGIVAAVIALRTTKQAIAANQAAQDRDRVLLAALRFREFVAHLATQTNGRRIGRRFDDRTTNELISELYLALKTAQFARHGDVEFKQWLEWIYGELVAQFSQGVGDDDQTRWVGQIADVLEGRLLDAAPLSWPLRVDVAAAP